MGAVVSVGFARNGSLLVVVEADGTVRLWDTERAEGVGILWNGNGTAPSSPPWYDEATDTIWVATSGKVLQFSLDSERWIERVCELVSRELTAWRVGSSRARRRPAASCVQLSTWASRRRPLHGGRGTPSLDRAQSCWQDRPMNDQFVVSTEWLAEHVHDDDVRALDVSGFLDDTGSNQAHDDYLAEHVPGAVWFDVVSARGELSDPDRRCRGRGRQSRRSKPP